MSIYVQSFKGETIDRDTLRNIFQIEQDMWAREKGLGEYIYCENCGKVSSKEGVYGDLVREIRIKTVADIERILGKDSVKCPCCGSGNTKHIRGNESAEHIKANFSLPDSFCTVMRGINQEVTGFMYGYVAPLDKIYEVEFKNHFFPEVMSAISDQANISIDSEMFSLPSVGTDESHMRLNYMLELMKNFFYAIPDKYDNLIGISETVVGSTMTKFYKYMGGLSIDVPKKNSSLLRTTEPLMDILIQPNVTYEYKNGDYNIRKIMDIYKDSAK